MLNARGMAAVLLALCLTACGKTPPPPIQPATDVGAQDRACEEELKAPDHAEAREWLKPEHVNHGGFKVGAEEMRNMTEELYQAGAVQVWVTGIEKVGDGEISASMLVELPKDPAARKRIFEWEAKLYGEEGETGTRDAGQKYLPLGLD